MMFCRVVQYFLLQYVLVKRSPSTVFNSDFVRLLKFRSRQYAAVLRGPAKHPARFRRFRREEMLERMDWRRSKVRTTPSFPSSPTTSTMAATMTTMSQGKLQGTLPMLEGWAGGAAR